MLQTWDSEGIELVANQKPPPQGLAFRVLEGDMQAGKGEEQPTVLLNFDAYELQKPARWDIPKAPIVGTHILEATNGSLIGLMAYSTGGK